MKKLFVPLAAAAVLAVVRGVTALSLAEPQTGFFPAGTAGFYTAALLLLTALSALLAGRGACPDGANALYSSPFGGAVLLVRGKNAVTVTLRGFRWNGRIVRDIYTVGLPSILMQSIGSVTAMGFNRILMGLSEGAVWVMGTYSKLENFLFMPLFGLTHGVLPLTGYNFGAKNRERMLQTMRYGLIIGISMMAVGMLIFWIFPRQLLGIFAPTPELMEMGVPALRTISLSFCLGAVGIILSTVFQAVGKGVYSLYISLLRQIVIVLPCAWALSFLGLEYVWFAFPVSNVVSMVLSIVMAKHLFRNYIDPILLDKGEAAR